MQHECNVIKPSNKIVLKNLKNVLVRIFVIRSFNEGSITWKKRESYIKKRLHKKDSDVKSEALKIFLATEKMRLHHGFPKIKLRATHILEVKSSFYLVEEFPLPFRSLIRQILLLKNTSIFAGLGWVVTNPWFMLSFKT